ncbi:hypothetical protein M422DRAFT_276684 [Sphaerobolus stellatus SS14]|uniref:Uncharacterized protein n=1 Tax=Sphaerobolus stellatus (strain SS14) TaxID=990650 RepID=A0A0C9T209_SPHS4|nr:hypothetical protein M422DRAFT_276684 [Sphaerobolus stellatus SS14]
MPSLTLLVGLLPQSLRPRLKHLLLPPSALIQWNGTLMMQICLHKQMFAQNVWDSVPPFLSSLSLQRSNLPLRNPHYHTCINLVTASFRQARR